MPSRKEYAFNLSAWEICELAYTYIIAPYWCNDSSCQATCRSVKWATRFTIPASYSLHSTCKLLASQYLQATRLTVLASYSLNSTCKLLASQYLKATRFTVPASYSLNSTCKLLASQYLQVFQTNCNNTRHNKKKFCQSSALGTDGTILRTSFSLHIPDRSSLSSAKECLVYYMWFEAATARRPLSKMQDSQIDKIRQRELLSLIPSRFSLFANTYSSMKQSRLWQYALRNSTNSLPFRAPKVVT